MKNKSQNALDKLSDLEGFSDKELAEAYIFPPNESPDSEKRDEEFWIERRKHFEDRTDQRKVYDKLLQLKFQLENYVENKEYEADSNFGYFLNEYVSRQEKQDKQFAAEIDITPAVLSSYINNHRKPPSKIIIRLELHSNGIIPAHTWFKLLQKDKEYQIMTDESMRKEESTHVKNKLQFIF